MVVTPMTCFGILCGVSLLFTTLGEGGLQIWIVCGISWKSRMSLFDPRVASKQALLPKSASVLGLREASRG